jgi:hypothetical protein
MTLVAPDRAFVSLLMAGNTEGMSGLFTPINDLAGLCGMAANALIVHNFLVLPVHKGKDQVHHFEFDDFRPLIRGSFGGNIHCPTEQRQGKKCRYRLLHHLIAPLYVVAAPPALLEDSPSSVVSGIVVIFFAVLGRAMGNADTADTWCLNLQLQILYL